LGLNRKFLFLTMGSILVPLLVLLLLMTVAWLGGYRDSPFSFSTVRTLDFLSSLEDRRWNPAELTRAMEEAYPQWDYILTDPYGKVLLSRPAGIDPSLLMENHTGERFSLTRVPLETVTGPAFLYIRYTLRKLSPEPVRRIFLISIPAVLIGFLSLGSLIILRSVNRSIVTLEEAARKIRDGDLQFQLIPRGNDRIASLTRTFDEMRQRVREEADRRSRFVLAISHDLKTPLSSITGYLDALEDGLGRVEDRQKYFNIIRTKTGLLENRISQLISFMKRETSEWRGTRVPVSAADFLEESALIFRNEAELRGFRFRPEIRVDSEVRLLMDEDLVFRALENLADNAFRYGDPGSEIRFSAFRENDTIRLSIASKGREILPEDLPYLFEPFYRGTRSRRETGFGLGLSVVASVVAGHGWTITVRSENRDTEFLIVMNTV